MFKYNTRVRTHMRHKPHRTNPDDFFPIWFRAAIDFQENLSNHRCREVRM